MADISFNIDEDLFEEFENARFALRMTKTEFVITAIKEKLERRAKMGLGGIRPAVRESDQVVKTSLQNQKVSKR